MEPNASHHQSSDPARSIPAKHEPFEELKAPSKSSELIKHALAHGNTLHTVGIRLVRELGHDFNEGDAD